MYYFTTILNSFSPHSQYDALFNKLINISRNVKIPFRFAPAESELSSFDKCTNGISVDLIVARLIIGK